jgi:5-methylcytosine-specific restriction endonuclease McrA
MPASMPAQGPRKPLPAKLREEVLLWGDCAYCGGIPTQVDHILPLSRGGTDDQDNLAPACKRCNEEKLDFPPEEYREYRESEGLGWPPPTMAQTIQQIIDELEEQEPGRFKAAVARWAASGKPLFPR